VHEELTESLVEELLATVSTKQRQTLLILDDCGEELRRIAPRIVNQLVSNSRHYQLSIVCLHQKLTQSPTIMRANADCIIAFAASSFLERECLYKEVSTIDRKAFMNMFSEATHDKHSFLVSTISKGGKLNFYKNDFKTKLL
jgi:hypothetical protein